jgi:hypothetical protein
MILNNASPILIWLFEKLGVVETKTELQEGLIKTISYFESP